MAILEKLLKIQTELKVPKNQENKFGGFWYRSCEDIHEALKPLLIETKTIINIWDDIVLIGDRFYVKSKVVLMDTESDGKETSTAFAREPPTKKGMDEAQITGSTSSYARKYALNGLFGIDDQKDSDNDKKPKADKKQVATVMDICDKIGKIKTKVKAEEFKTWINGLKGYTEQQKNVMLAKLEEQIKQCV